MWNSLLSETLSTGKLQVQGMNFNCDEGTEAQLEYYNVQQVQTSERVTCQTSNFFKTNDVN